MIARWHRAVATNDLSDLEDYVADDAEFSSPAVFTPQRGKALVAKYLRAAMLVLNDSSFRYTDQWLGNGSAVLEFDVTIDGTYANGVDIIRWNEAGAITYFKVMVRPLKGLTALVALMGARLEATR